MTTTGRRELLLGLGSAAGVAGASLVALGLRVTSGAPFDFGTVGQPVETLVAEPRCAAGTVTPPQGAGPFYTARTPERRDIRDPFVSANTLVLAGRVLDARCQPIAGAVLDFWQTDHDGVYDQHSYRYRGHQYTDAEGRFELVTVRPHAYTAMSIFRTPHIHVMAQGPATPLLATQLYLPDADETNARDGGYAPSLAVRYVGREGAARRAAFDFVLPTA
jgi:protocatechuate 3,4-dioxygenase beta subunit